MISGHTSAIPMIPVLSESTSGFLPPLRGLNLIRGNLPPVAPGVIHICPVPGPLRDKGLLKRQNMTPAFDLTDAVK
jgi:hypothetical protein